MGFRSTERQPPVYTKMDRLGRNIADMMHIVDACNKKGIAIRFLENG